MNREQLASLMAPVLTGASASAASQYAAHDYFVVDNLLPVDVARQIFDSFPSAERLMLRKSLRELKYVTSQMDGCARLVEEAVFAFQDPRIVHLVESITGLRAVEPDPSLYASGISVMGNGHYLMPHIDNSHDMKRERYRVLNLLYYVTPEWPEDVGGNFELWPEGKPLTIHAKFNRLLVIATNRTSWHSVSKIHHPGLRTCVSNYYFSPISPEGTDYFHVTSFRGRPGQPLTNLALRADAWMRGMVRKVKSGGIFQTKHVYRR
jgi:Rps23 Pro-64 3,4-dihydroxylase Tpa1-like proline 4-hydroxylase